MLVMTHALSRSLALPLGTVLGNALPAVDDHFTVLAVEVVQEGVNDVLRVRANLSRPTQVGGRTVYPFGWHGTRAGGFQVERSLASVFQYSAVTLIFAVAWPPTRVRILLLRLLVAIPLVTILLVTDEVCTVTAELWGLVQQESATDSISGWMVSSRLLMGGGGLALAVVIGVASVAVAAYLTRSEPPNADAGAAPATSLR
jgi:hypothetical protein